MFGTAQDLLGYRYSLLSSIATGGMNNVICLIPSRNVSENEHFPHSAKIDTAVQILKRRQNPDCCVDALPLYAFN